MTSTHLNLLRRQLRKRRHQLNRYQQRQAEQACWQKLLYMPQFQHAQHIGVYLNAFGEIATRQIIMTCFKQHKRVYLPLICEMNQHLHWQPITAQQYLQRRFSRHRLGMQQAMAHRAAGIQQLDLLIMPLLACDSTGMRLGMGGGYYDRSLSQAPQHPFRLALAHDFQVLQQSLPQQPWDQAVDALLSPRQLRYFHQRRP
ncbi:5-formyltetrahydrofolate cyclo-ligase [Acinetobacter larvae]|uniref:5-formyltetrahydrofolate cyclo-ligase n=1 Tax=Acinetobacter larvae TaxID=1789224 RepID=A0A1B2LXW6_9GAMM|nr:5-formyltetrahydrofolate cyclo-ligase [Acinetobacter larvae]AOA57812.1 5-formyltetrahydrofolate cyclo-ligase [Acinetobacter larvae]